MQLTPLVKRLPNDTRISVVIPNYWDGKLILETLCSIKEQEPIEVVVVDDCSPEENTIKLLNQYKNEGLISKLILHTENQGVAAAINSGVHEATSPYAFILGNDDLLEPNALKKLADILDNNPSFEFAAGAYKCFGARTDTRKPGKWDHWMALYRNLWPGCMMVRRDTFDRVGGQDSDLIYHDWDFYLRLAAHNVDGYITDDLVYRYRVHSGGRLWASSRKGWGTEYSRIRSRHPELYNKRTALRKNSVAPIWYQLWLFSTAWILWHAPQPIVEAIFTIVQGFDRFKWKKDDPSKQESSEASL